MTWFEGLLTEPVVGVSAVDENEAIHVNSGRKGCVKKWCVMST